MGKFRIKIKSAGFSKDYIVLRYSTNGIFWKSVKEYEYDLLDNWYYMTTKIRHFSNAEHLLKKFSTLEKIKQFEAEQKDIVRKLNAEISERNRKDKENRKSIYRRYG